MPQSRGFVIGNLLDYSFKAELPKIQEVASGKRSSVGSVPWQKGRRGREGNRDTALS